MYDPVIADLNRYLKQEEEHDQWEAYCQTVEEELRDSLGLVPIGGNDWELQDDNGGCWLEITASSVDDAIMQVESQWESLAIAEAKQRIKP